MGGDAAKPELLKVLLTGILFPVEVSPFMIFERVFGRLTRLSSVRGNAASHRDCLPGCLEKLLTPARRSWANRVNDEVMGYLSTCQGAKENKGGLGRFPKASQGTRPGACSGVRLLIYPCFWRLTIIARLTPTRTSSMVDCLGAPLPRSGSVMSAMPHSSTSSLRNPTVPYSWLGNLRLMSWRLR